LWQHIAIGDKLGIAKNRNLAKAVEAASCGIESMPTVFACPTCGTRLKVPSEFVGREVQCPHCKKLLIAPRKSANRSDPDDDDVDELDQYIIPVDAEGRQKRRDEKYCQECGEIIRAKAVICPKCGVEQAASDSYHHADANRIGAGICGILIGSLGIHKFILGLTGPGLTMLLITVCSLFGGLLVAFATCGLGFPLVGLGPMAMSIIGLIEGIIYLSKSDEEFYRDYVVRRKGWF
jgi:predicted RNA-binding Zn-ribbon protein involved in translation (DUF1610 family)/TM2 domain-containing membrane protein YozV